MQKISLVAILVFIQCLGLSAALNFSPPQPRSGEIVAFTLRVSGPVPRVVTWDFGDGSPKQAGGALATTHVYAAIGSYTAKASYKPATGMLLTEQATVRVINPRRSETSPASSVSASSITTIPGPLSPKPSPDIKKEPVSADTFKNTLKNTPRFEGAIDCSPASANPSGTVILQGYVNITLDGKPVTGATVAVNQVPLPEHAHSSDPPGCYSLPGSKGTAIPYAPGGPLTMTVKIGGTTYTGSSTFANVALFTKPANLSVVHLKSQPQVDFQWKYSSGFVEPVQLFIGPSLNVNNVIFKQEITADHFSIPTATFSKAAGTTTCVWLMKGFKNITFDGMAAITSKVIFCWGNDGPQIYLNVQDD